MNSAAAAASATIQFVDLFSDDEFKFRLEEPVTLFNHVRQITVMAIAFPGR